jgi:hypothetical protein
MRRFRTDGFHIADLKAQGKAREEWFEATLWDPIPPAELGDVWRIHWAKCNDAGHTIDGPLAGYAIFCPKCHTVHCWTTATNCAQKAGTSCPHEGTGSCWTWSGSAESGTLTASPSLHCVLELGGCGWHGWLNNGEMSGC